MAQLFKVKALGPGARLPMRASPGSAAFDVFAYLPSVEEVTIPSSRAVTIRTGLAFILPEGWCMKVLSRSGHGFKFGVSLSNSVGLIDSDYTGELMISLRNEGIGRFLVRHEDRIAQILFERVEPVDLGWTQDDMPVTQRGAGGLGSTGGISIEGAA